MGLKPWERDRMNPSEILEMWDGYLWRRRDQAQLLAVATAHGMVPMIGGDALKKNLPLLLQHLGAEDPEDEASAGAES